MFIVSSALSPSQLSFQSHAKAYAPSVTRFPFLLVQVSEIVLPSRRNARFENKGSPKPRTSPRALREVPRALKEAPKRLQELTKRLQESSKNVPRAPQDVLNTLKTTPRPPKEPPRPPEEPTKRFKETQQRAKDTQEHRTWGTQTFQVLLKRIQEGVE